MNGQMDGGMRNIITSIKESIGQSIYSLASQSINQSTNPWASQLEKQSVILIDWLTGWLTDWLTNRLFCLLIHDPLKLIAQSVQNQANLHSSLAQRIQSDNSDGVTRLSLMEFSPDENDLTTSVYMNFASASLLCITSCTQSKVTVRSYFSYTLVCILW